MGEKTTVCLHEITIHCTLNAGGDSSTFRGQVLIRKSPIVHPCLYYPQWNSKKETPGRAQAVVSTGKPS